MTTDNACIFCQMAIGEFPVEKLHEDGLVFAINDIGARAPTHILVIPKQHFASVRELKSEHGPIVGHMVTTAQDVAERVGIAPDGYRLTINVGANGGQTIPHLHMHLMGGRKMGPEG